ncbi:hypothetical protein [Paenibacillus lautus]|uniref:hypothetical protein n=1 Tax=Paenibacillus lautus TaxID=1401 RepID=UPI003D2AD2AC
MQSLLIKQACRLALLRRYIFYSWLAPIFPHPDCRACCEFLGLTGLPAQLVGVAGAQLLPPLIKQACRLALLRRYIFYSWLAPIFPHPDCRACCEFLGLTGLSA